MIFIRSFFKKIPVFPIYRSVLLLYFIKFRISFFISHIVICTIIIFCFLTLRLAILLGAPAGYFRFKIINRFRYFFGCFLSRFILVITFLIFLLIILGFCLIVRSIFRLFLLFFRPFLLFFHPFLLFFTLFVLFFTLFLRLVILLVHLVILFLILIEYLVILIIR
jgi:hypothetical protein